MKKLLLIMMMSLLIVYKPFCQSQFSESSATTKSLQQGLIDRSQSVNFNVEPGYANGFIENKGTFIDQNGKKNDEVSFLFQSGPFKLYLRKKGFSYELWKPVNNSSSDPQSVLEGETEIKTALIESYRIDVSFEGGNENTVWEAREPLAGTLNFLQNRGEQKGVTGMRKYKEVICKNIYSGIDVIFKIDPENKKAPLEYHFIVRPDGDVKNIALSYHFDGHMARSFAGDLQLQLPVGTIEETAPISYINEGGASIASKSILNKNIVSFDLKGQPKDKTIVIDPSISWSTYMGGENQDRCFDIMVDDSKNVLIAGQTISTTNIATSGAYQTTYGGGDYDAFFAKYDADGNMQWSTYYGGEGLDVCDCICSDHDGNYYITGGTNSHAGIATPSSLFPNYCGGIFDGYLTKFDSDGQLVWGTYYGGTGQDEVLGIDCDSLGYVYISGYTYSNNNMVYGTAYQDSLVGTIDAFLAKFNGNGERIWSTYFGGDGNDRTHDLVIDHDNNIVIAGTTGSHTNIAMETSFQPTFGGDKLDMFIAKFTDDDERIFSTYYGGDGMDHGRAIAVDLKNNIYVIGYTNSTTGISTSNGHQLCLNAVCDSTKTADDSYMAMLTPNGQRKWGTYYGGEGVDHGRSVTTNSFGDIYFAGDTRSDDYISTPGAFITSPLGKDDIFLAKFDTLGVVQMGTYLGSENDDHNMSLMSEASFIYLANNADSGAMITASAEQTEYAGPTHDGYVIKFYIGDDCYDSYEPNNSKAKAFPLKTIVDTSLIGYQGKISTVTDVDWFSFQITSDQPYFKVVLSQLPANYSLKVVNGAGNVVGTSKNPGTSDEIIIINSGITGTYYVKINRKSGFSDFSCYDLKVIVSDTPIPLRSPGVTENFIDENDFLLIPNPANNEVTMQFIAPVFSMITIRIYDVVGKLVESTQILSSDPGINEKTFDTSTLANGLYAVQILIDKKQRIHKLLVQH